ncbi:MAG: DNA polymerase III subunit gamma/tau [Bacteroidales bacterium]|nr:DNA polymerase III subunit gamma/tau [Bacteroidales bacterium]
MENYIVSARKYRPIDFKSVVGQKSVTVTLKNSIKNSQLAHAYLFSGPRGVGKTSCARIFAKTINCENRKDDFEACNECESCISFNEGRSYNIHELDAASNNSVEDIRNLIEQVRIPPQIGTHSVYIIDEVHMLSSQAFNAFLKTLEEPPSYAIFVLATTEKHKIIPTILSRCQIFDFNRIKVEDAVNYLSYIATQEKIEAEEEALNIIAQKADGAMRDALSFFDQIVSFSGKKITYQATIDNLNVLDYDYYFKLTDFIYENNLSESLLIFNEILNNGFDGHHFITGLSSHFRDLMVCKDASTVQLLEVGSSIKDKYLSQAQKINLNFLLKALEISNKTDLSYRGSRNKRLQIELALMQMCTITNQAVEKKKTEPAQEKTPIVSEKKEVYQKENKTAPKQNTIIKKSGISLNSEIKKETEETTENSEINNSIGTSEINEDLLNKAWAKFAEKLKSKIRLYNALKDKKLTVINKNTAELTVTNNNLEQTLNKIKSRMLDVMRKELNNKFFELQIKVQEFEENNSEHLYTDRDKYKYLVNKNPNLDKLKNKFDLDF